MNKVFTWIVERKKQCIYWALAAVLLFLGVLLVIQKGFYIQSRFDQTFYRLQSRTETERVFHGKDADIIQKGFFPDCKQVFITVTPNGQEPVLWELTMNGKNQNGFYRLIANDGKNQYEGTYSGKGNHFSFADGSVSFTQFQSEAYIGSLLRMAYGDTDKNNQYAPLLFLYVLVTVVAYLSLFHAQAIFDWNKQWEFSFRNREELKPSDWYFLQHKILAAVEIALALWLWLLATGIWTID